MCKISKLVGGFSLVSIYVFALFGCGGGGDGGSQSTGAVLEGNTGFVSALFVPTNPRYVFLGDGELNNAWLSYENIGSIVTYTQGSNGVVTSLTDSTGTISVGAPPNNKLPYYGFPMDVNSVPDVNAPITKEISGDAYFAMGRWAIGSSQIYDHAKVLSAMHYSNYSSYIYYDGAHYLLINRASSFPVSASMTCNDGYFTAATYYDGVPPDSILNYAPADITGNASLSFDGSGAHFQINLHADVLQNVNAYTNYSGDVIYSGVIATLSSTAFPLGASVFVGDGGSGSYLLSGIFHIETDSATKYRGLMVFRCQ